MCDFYDIIGKSNFINMRKDILRTKVALKYETRRAKRAGTHYASASFSSAR